MTIPIIALYGLIGFSYGIYKFFTSQNVQYTLCDALFSVLFGGVIVLVGLLVFIIEVLINLFIWLNMLVIVEKDNKAAIIKCSKRK